MDKNKLRALYRSPLAELVLLADSVRRKYAGSELELCNILNAKSGCCDQDCRFCAQSARHKTDIARYPLVDREKMLEAARRAKEIGAERFDIVTSGNKLTGGELKIIADVVRRVTGRMGMKMCASLGEMDAEGFRLLKKAGLTRYHHNLETSPRFFPKIVTTHTFQDRVRTIKNAQAAGLEVCSGGIVGMGEGADDRIDLALWLKKLDVHSVPINVLVPIPGTALAAQERFSAEEAIRTIAIFRIILKDKIIKIAAGRESVLKDFQALAFMAGANGMLIGGYLTIRGRSVEEDHRLVREIKRLWKN